MANNHQQRTSARRSTGDPPVAIAVGAPVRLVPALAVRNIPAPTRIVGFRRIGRRNIPEADAWWIAAEDAWRITWRCGQIIFVPLLDHVLGRLAGFGCDTITIERCGCGK